MRTLRLAKSAMTALPARAALRISVGARNFDLAAAQEAMSRVLSSASSPHGSPGITRAPCSIMSRAPAARTRLRPRPSASFSASVAASTRLRLCVQDWFRGARPGRVAIRKDFSFGHRDTEAHRQLTPRFFANPSSAGVGLPSRRDRLWPTVHWSHRADPARLVQTWRSERRDGAASRKLLPHDSSANRLVAGPRPAHRRRPATAAAAILAAVPRSAVRSSRVSVILTRRLAGRTSGSRASRANRSKPAPPAARDRAHGRYSRRAR